MSIPLATQQHATSSLLATGVAGFGSEAVPTQQHDTGRLLGTSPSGIGAGSTFATLPTSTQMVGAQQQAPDRLLGAGVGNLGTGATHQQATAGLLGSSPAYTPQQQAAERLLGTGVPNLASGTSPPSATQQQATERLLGGAASLSGTTTPALASQQKETERLLGTGGRATNPGYATQQQTTDRLLGTGAAGLGQATQQHATDRLLGTVSYMPKPQGQSCEMHFIGELEVGSRFPGVSFNEGLFVDYQVQAGGGWTPIAKESEGYAGQTQTAYADAEGEFVFNHPLDLNFFTSSLADWPKLHLQVLRLDATGRVDTVSYGAIGLPMAPGHAELVCRTWTPLSGSAMAEARAVHTGDRAELIASRADVLDAKLPEERTKLLTKTSGNVRISIDAIFRNAAEQGILLPGRKQAPQTMRTDPPTWR